MEGKSKATETIKTISEIIAKLGEATNRFGLCVTDLANNGDSVDNIKVDVNYIRRISGYVNERAECVLSNISGRDGMNQYSEDELSDRLSYDKHVEDQKFWDKVDRMYSGMRKAEDNGQSGSEWLKEHYDFNALVDYVEGKVKEPWKPEPGIIGKILKEWRRDRYSLYSIAKEQNCRVEGLRRIEEGKDVTTTNLMHYLHFIKMHEPESPVIAKIWSVL